MAAAKLSIVPRETHYSCAELVEVAWRAAPGQDYVEYAILAEIWNQGGVFLVDQAADPGTPMRIILPHGEIRATVLSCREERHSYALEVHVHAADLWFGGAYQPAVLVPGEVAMPPLPQCAMRSEELIAHKAGSPAVEMNSRVF